MDRNTGRHLRQAAHSKLEMDVIINPYFLPSRSPIKRGLPNKSPGRPSISRSPVTISPNKSQRFSSNGHSQRKESIKKGLFQIEIQRHAKQNQPTANLALSSQSCRAKPNTHMFQNAIKATTSTVLREPIRFSQLESPSMSQFIQGQKLCFKRISSDILIRDKQKTKMGMQQGSQYQLECQQSEQPVHSAASPLQLSFARQLSIDEEKLQKDSLKTAETEGAKREIKTEQQESLWNESDRVNMSQSDSRVQLDMSPYFT